ncbi:MAG: hypothetical protein RI885_1244 [Actinomycetota bacterium]
MELTVYAVGVMLLTLFDGLVSDSLWFGLYFVSVAVLGTFVVRERVPRWVLGLVSLAATVGFRVVGDSAGASGSFGLGEGFILLVVIVAASRRAVGPIGWPSVAVLVTALLCVPFRLSDDVLLAMIALLAAAGCALAVGAVLRNLDAERRLALAIATQDERDGFARELHDDVTNRVTGMMLMIQALRRSTGRSGADLDRELARVEAAGSEALTAMRRWVATLREGDGELDSELGRELGPELPGTPLPEVRRLLEQWEATSSGGRARLIDETRGEVHPDVQSTLHRIVQEAVTNVSRHAPGSAWLEVSLTQERDSLVLRIRNPVDDEAGIDPVPGSAGLGLIGMQERAHILGGIVEAGLEGSSIWSVRVTVPLVGTA